MMRWKSWVLLGLSAVWLNPVWAQLAEPLRNVVQLSARAEVQATQDWLTLYLSVREEGSSAQSVQSKIKTALDLALAQAKPWAKAEQMRVRTGNIAVNPRHDRDGRIKTWQGSAELVLEGLDFDLITRVAGQIQTMTLRGASMGLSREAERQLQAQAQAQAIEAFQRKAAQVAQAFGFSGYSLREVTVGGDGDAFAQAENRPLSLARAASPVPMDSAPVPVAAGQATLSVTVDGSVQLQR